MFQFQNANIIHDTPAGLTKYNFQTMDIDDFIRWCSRFIVLRSQRKLTGEAKDAKSGVMCVLAPVYFIGRTSRGKPFLTVDKSGVTKPNFN